MRETSEMQVTTVGLDLAKNLFQVHGADAEGRPVLKRRLARGKVLEFFANLPACLVGLEACVAAHHWARELTRLGHQVRLMPPQHVRPYVKTNTHDAADAEAICEAVQRPGMRFVPVKGEEQQSVLTLHRIREQLLKQRTATINALRAHLAEFGIVAAQRQTGLRELLAVVADAEDRRLPPLARELLQLLADHLRALQERTAELDRRLVAAARDGAACERLVAVPGIGPVIATALVATIGDAKTFSSGRHLAAWAGLVPRQHSSGGKERLLGISKRGDGYLRRQLVHGARALVAVAKGREGGLWTWVNGLLARRPYNVAVAAVANKLARIAWALLSRGETYRAATA
jgi:transposase